MFIDSLVFPRDRKIWPNSTSEQDVNRFKSSALAIFKVSRRYLLKNKKKCSFGSNLYQRNYKGAKLAFIKT